MIPGEVSDILLHAFKKLQPGIWYVVDDTNRFNPSVRKALSLSPSLYNSLLQLSGILHSMETISDLIYETLIL